MRNTAVAATAQGYYPVQTFEIKIDQPGDRLGSEAKPTRSEKAEVGDTSYDLLDAVNSQAILREEPARTIFRTVDNSIDGFFEHL